MRAVLSALGGHVLPGLFLAIGSGVLLTIWEYRRLAIGRRNDVATYGFAGGGVLLGVLALALIAARFVLVA